MNARTIFRKNAPLSKDRAKSLVASGLQRAVAAHGLSEVAAAAGCCDDYLRKTLGHVSLPALDMLYNALDLDPTILDELNASKGLRFTPLHSEASNDMSLAAGLSGVLREICTALEDGSRDHRETLRVADAIRPHLPALTAIVREADALRGAA